MRGDLDVLLVSTSVELTGILDVELDRQLAWLRCWYGRREWPQAPVERFRVKDSAWR